MVGLSFAFTSIVVTKAIGVGLAVAVALDATVIRVLMVPAAMRLLGRLELVAAELAGLAAADRVAGGGLPHLAARAFARSAAGLSE